MTLERRIKTGPLSTAQKTILSALADGKRQKEIAFDLCFSQAYVSAEACLAVMKMGVRTTPAAVARYKVYLAYLEAAQVIRNYRIGEPFNRDDQHVNHILTDLAELLEKRAEKLLPS